MLQEMTLGEAQVLGSPCSYVVVVTIDKNNKTDIMGVGMWTFTSPAPPMLAISVKNDHYTSECLQACPEFVLCLPSEEQAKEAWFCGTKSGRNIDKLAETKLTTVPSRIVRPPIIAGSTVAYECQVTDRVQCGVHTLFNSNIVAFHGDKERAKHLYSIPHQKLVSIDYTGKTNFNLSYL